MTGSLLRYVFWHSKDPSSPINVICLMPNGISITIPGIPADTPLYQIKAELWRIASNKALFHWLQDTDDYSFVVISNKGGSEELLDETQSLFDVKPSKPYLKIVKKQGDKEEKILNSKINILIGSHFNGGSKNEEVIDFRNKCMKICRDISEQRGTASWEKRAIYTYPPEFCRDGPLPQNLKLKLELQKNKLHLGINILKNTSHTFEVPDTVYPRDLVELALRKKYQTINLRHVEDPDDYIVKVFGRLSFFLGETNYDEHGRELYMEKPVIQYKYIRDCLMWDKKPMLTVVPKCELDVVPVKAPSISVPPPVPPKSGGKEICLWDLSPSTMLRIKINFALNVTAPQMSKEVHCGVFHGGEELCQTQKTSLIDARAPNPKWNEYLQFDIAVVNLPRMARLCISVVGYNTRKNRNRRGPSPLAWVNLPLFNHRGILQSGQIRLPCWQYGLSKISKKEVKILNPLGTVATSNNENGPCIYLDLMNFAHTVRYPQDETIFELAACCVKSMTDNLSNNPLLARGSSRHRMQIEEIIKKDALSSMSDDDKDLLWTLRGDCYEFYPQSLPKLLQSVKWNSKEYVSQIHFFLDSWKNEDLDIEIALDLLDYKFPHIKVRACAIEVLKRLCDIELEMYLLQLVQALKFESYLDSPLARYLLKRALNNRRIGHYLFWHLRAEVSNPECSMQFGLLLEMYCRGSIEHIPILLRQVEAINKMKTVTELLQTYKDDLIADDPKNKKNKTTQATEGEMNGPNKLTNGDDKNDKKLASMRHCFRGYARTFTDLISPLDPTVKMKSLKVSKCKYMDSKKKPLFLVFENADPGADDVYILFKNGDDLKQDMLTLLCLRLMESVWEKEDLNYGIIPYRCLSTGPMVGLIEIVTNSETLAKIQVSITGVLNEKSLYNWLENCCRESRNLDVCVENFTRSVVGYSVATYVLGIGDRHNDNIMMKKDSGQLFHIDFGHFLGNFKYKFGIKRERVKFVLTSDILYIIKQGASGTEHENFESVSTAEYEQVSICWEEDYEDASSQQQTQEQWA